jgi:1A family penicillin-binding protein
MSQSKHPFLHPIHKYPGKPDNKKPGKNLRGSYENVKKHFIQNIKHLSFKTLLLMGGIGLFFVGIIIIWASTLKLPDLDGFQERKVVSSTKIYDRTGEIVLFDVHKDIQRTVVESSAISPYVKNASVAIEDDQFYKHQGIDLKAIIRATLTNIRDTGFSQGGSTITQQVIKNTLLTRDKRISRKIKEAFLAIRLERRLTKDEILTHYLNIVPYGGTIYGIEEASRAFFGKTASDITLAESAYLAALPNAPTFYSPYGNNTERLETRKKLILDRMLKLDFITPEEHQAALEEVVVFRPREDRYAKALHFVEYIRAQLEEKYGAEAIENDGLRVITTLNYDLQKKAEDFVLENALANEENWGASNQGVVALDPHTGQILTMVGSRDYFDTEIDGSFNVALAKRQPGSSFKPFAYVTAFKEGYTPNTVVFDTRTQFSTACSPYDTTNTNPPCYSPQNYDGLYNGPTTLRAGLAESRNIPSVKVLYLVGVTDALRTAKDMGITSLGDPNQYGLTLVLGGGEVSLLEMTSAYGVFATGGIKNPYTGILRIEDKKGNVLEEFKERPERVLDQQPVALLNDVLSDNTARLPLFQSVNNYLYFGEGRDIAGKTGTTNNNRDAWLIGYSPDVVVGVWTGNNDNTPMRKGSAISGPTFRNVMAEALKETPNSRFDDPAEINTAGMRPILRGEWRGGEVAVIDTISGLLATEYTPEETKKEVALVNPHNILHWINKNDPLGPAPTNPAADNQYNHWEIPVQKWLEENKNSLDFVDEIPTEYDNVHTANSRPNISILTPTENALFLNNATISIDVSTNGKHGIEKVHYFLNDIFIGFSDTYPFSFSFNLTDVAGVQQTNTLRAVVYDKVMSSSEDITEIIVN